MAKLTLLLYLFCSVLVAHANRPILVIYPAVGIGRNPGRMLFEGFERGVTLRCAQKLQERLVDLFDVRISRQSGQHIGSYHLAVVANTTRADYVVSLHVYHHESMKPTIDVYHLRLDPLEDAQPVSMNTADVTPVRFAHREHQRRSRSCAQAVVQYLRSEESRRYVLTRGPFGIPLTPLIGIRPPAIAVEIGCCNEESWKGVVPQLASALAEIASM